MQLACLDLEGVLVPEVWIAVAEAAGIAELRLRLGGQPRTQLVAQRIPARNHHPARAHRVRPMLGRLRQRPFERQRRGARSLHVGPRPHRPGLERLKPANRYF